MTYGSSCGTAYDPYDAEHASRKNRIYTDHMGTQRLSGYFDVILKKVSLLSLVRPFVDTDGITLLGWRSV